MWSSGGDDLGRPLPQVAQAAPRGLAMEHFKSSFECAKISQRSSRSTYTSNYYNI